MSIDEAARHQLFRELERSIGLRSATALMELLPPVGWADVATKRDLDALRVEFKGDLAVLEGRVLNEIGGLKGGIGAIEGKIRGLEGEVGGLRGEVGGLRSEIGALRGETRTIVYANIGSMLGFGAIVLAAAKLA